MAPTQEPRIEADDAENVTFIDYEYAVSGPAAFDLANHFAEWGGFDCDYTVLPTTKTRRAFLELYLDSYKSRLSPSSPSAKASSSSMDLDALFSLVDRFRGIPGLYWGIWALIQATISQIDFNYAEYAEIRLGEYFAWREETDGTRREQGKEIPLRERRWME